MAYGLYIHIPYCQSRCRYCDFYSTPGRAAVPDAYIDAVLRDLALYAPDGKAPDTVYFGGGTPSLLQPAQVKRLLNAARPAPDAEITLEANPESVDAQKLAGWRDAGVNRLSFGVQTASDESLARLGRPHRARDAEAALALARKTGFGNISADVMLALPGYTTDEFDATLALLRQGGVCHVSAYMLKIEPGTPFGKRPPPGVPGEDTAADHYLYAAQRLEDAGYAQYEISNFARPGRQSRHNLLYWNLDDWLGLGPGAHSSLAGRRFAFGQNLDAYIEESPVPLPQGPVEANDYIMMRLRLAGGLREADLQARFGTRLAENQRQFLAVLCQKGLAVQTKDGWALTRQGMLVQNAILGQLLG